MSVYYLCKQYLLAVGSRHCELKLIVGREVSKFRDGSHLPFPGIHADMRVYVDQQHPWYSSSIVL